MGSISVSVSIKAKMNKVWESFTKPEHIVNWNFASIEWHCPKAINNLKSEGEFSWRMEAKDGSMGFDFEGRYLEIISEKRITYEMADGRKVEVNFSQKGEEVMVAETFETEGTIADEQQRAGWQAILVNFKNYVEAT